MLKKLIFYSTQRWSFKAMLNPLSQIENQSLIKTNSFINGAWHQSDKQFIVENPFDNTKLASLSEVTEQHVEFAIESAKAAQSEWQKTPAQQRAGTLIRWANLMRDNINDLALILTLEQGKPFNEAKGELNYGISYLDWFAEEAKRVYGDIIPSLSEQHTVLVQKQAVGVVAAITPWNFPNAMITRKAAAAIAAGCTFIAKPSELTPLSALAIAELAKQAGLPDGVFNVLIGTQAPQIGKQLTSSSSIAKLSFTGSTAVGKTLLAQCASTVKRTSMELGGNAPFIVFEDADLEAAATGLIAAKFRNSGQTCVCANRIFVAKSIYQEFLALFTKKAQNLNQGNGLDEVDLGVMISQEAIEKNKKLVDSAVQSGAHIHYQASSVRNSYPLTILTNCSNQMAIAQAEIFGPVAAIISFNDEDEVIEQANATDFGLAGYFYSQDLSRVMRVANQLKFGMLGINEGIISNAAAPFGGVKQSGFGREGSKYGLDDYLETKYLCLKA